MNLINFYSILEASRSDDGKQYINTSFFKELIQKSNNAVIIHFILNNGELIDYLKKEDQNYIINLTNKIITIKSKYKFIEEFTILVNNIKNNSSLYDEYIKQFKNKMELLIMNEDKSDIIQEIAELKPSLIDEIKFIMNPSLSNDICQLYRVLIGDEKYFLLKKEVFMHAITLSVEQVNLIINVLSVVKDQDKLNEIYKLILNNQFSLIYQMYLDLFNEHLCLNIFDQCSDDKSIDIDKFISEYYHHNINNFQLLFNDSASMFNNLSNNTKIKYKELSNFIAPPNRSHDIDTGADLFSPIDIDLMPNERIALPLGLAIEVPIGLTAIVFTKSSTFKKGLIAYEPPIDSGYTGEIHAPLHNVTEEVIHIKKGDKVAQLVFIPIVFTDYIKSDELFVGQRGTGAFGSTGSSLCLK